MVLLSNYNVGDLFGLATSALVVTVIPQLKVLLSSVDVIHAIALPGIGLKLDAIPSRLSDQTVLFVLAGIYRGQCSELCGALHGFMPLTFL